MYIYLAIVYICCFKDVVCLPDRTVVELEGLSEEEEVAETLRIHKEVVAGVRLQPWPIARWGSLLALGLNS